MGRRPLWRSTTLHSGKTTSAPPANVPCGHQLYKMDEVCCHSDTELSFEGEAKSTDMLRDRQQAEERLLLRETGTQERSRGTCSGACSRSRIEHRLILRIALHDASGLDATAAQYCVRPHGIILPSSFSICQEIIGHWVAEQASKPPAPLGNACH